MRRCWGCVIVPGMLLGWLALGVGCAFAAEDECLSLGEMTDALGDRGELPFGIGESDLIAGTQTILFVDPASRGWTVIVTGPSGAACVADYGTGFRAAPAGDPA